MTMPSSTTRYGRDADKLLRDAGSTAEAAYDKAAKVAGQAQTAAQEQLDNLTAAVRRNPLQAASIAAGIGFLLAVIVRR